MYKALFISGFKASIHFKFDLILSLCEKGIRLFILYYFFQAILPNNLFLKTFDYLVIAVLLEGAIQNDILDLFAQKVEKGEIIYWLIRPQKLLLVLINFSFGKNALNIFVSLTGLALVGYFLGFHFINYLAFAVSLALSFAIACQLQYMTSLLILQTINSWGVKMFYKAIFLFFSGAFIPIFLLPLSLHKFYTFLPFYYCVGSPIAILTTQNSFHELPIQFGFVTLLYFFISHLHKRMVPEAIAVGG